MDCVLDTKRDLNEIWHLVCKDLAEYYGETLYKSWFSKVTFSDSSDYNKIILISPTNFVRDWIKSSYNNVILDYFKQYETSIKSVDIITQKGEEASIAIEQSDNKDNANDNYQSNFTSIKSHTLDARFTFDNFVVGTPNELAYSAARAVAESQSAILESNPLFLYGGVGLGKTHLMHAIAWHVKTLNPHRKVLYMSAEKFMYSFIQALRNKDVMMFKEKFRNVDILMIDDIQFICGKDSTQEEFFHTFNAIIDNNKQMVISCDRSPADLNNIEDRIKSRLGWGLVADVHSTTYELRLGILQSKVEQMSLHVPKEVLEFLAARIVSNVRELEGALNKVVAHTKFTQKPITLDITRYILKDLLKSNEKNITIDLIQKRISNYYNINISDMFSIKRNRVFARPRQVAMYIAKMLTPKSLVDIGAQFGKKDHTTVMHAIRTIEKLKNENRAFSDEIDVIINSLQSI